MTRPRALRVSAPSSLRKPESVARTAAHETNCGMIDRREEFLSVVGANGTTCVRGRVGRRREASRRAGSARERRAERYARRAEKSKKSLRIGVHRANGVARGPVQ
jgi:hypothetical protein